MAVANKNATSGSAASRQCQAPAQTKVDDRVYDERSRTGTLSRVKNAERAAKVVPPLYVTTPEHASFLAQILREEPGAGMGAQCSRLLRAAERGVTVFEAVSLLDVLNPNSRYPELRKAGYEFDQTWVQHASPSGRLHTVYHYVRRRDS